MQCACLDTGVAKLLGLLAERYCVVGLAQHRRVTAMKRDDAGRTIPEVMWCMSNFGGGFTMVSMVFRRSLTDFRKPTRVD